MTTTHNGEMAVSLDRQTFDPVDIDSLPLPSSLNLQASSYDDEGDVNIMGLLPDLPPVDISGDAPGNLDQIISALPPPIPIDTYSLEYGPTSSTEPQLEPLPLTEDGEIPRFDEVNDQYEFLRKTLSHSRRRYSARFKRPRPTPQRQEDNDEQSSLDFPGKKRTSNIESNLDTPTGMVHSPPHHLHQHTKHHSFAGTHHHKQGVRRKPGLEQNRNSSPAVNRRKSNFYKIIPLIIVLLNHVVIYILYCIILYYIILYYIVLYCIILYCIILYYIILYYIVLYYIIYDVYYIQNTSISEPQ